jgi:putative ABC transport system substrate-binding protein
MQRRDFIKWLSGCAAIWPLAAHAQQPDRIRRVGVLMGGAETDPISPARSRAFKQRLHDLGWIEGRNLRLDVLWAAGGAGRLSLDRLLARR